MNQIQEIKQRHGQQAETIIANGLNLVRVGSKYRCPNNGAHKNNDRNPSMSWDMNALQYHCFTCGINIDLYGYYREHLNYSHNEIIRDLLGVEHSQTNINKKVNDFKTECQKIVDIDQKCKDYIKTRAISEGTIKYFKLKSYNGMIAFPYYRYETVVGYKTRKPIPNPDKPKMQSVKGSKPYLFNAQNLNNDYFELIICEGEFDCMAIYQCNYDNVVSVGAGANSLSTLLEQAKELFNKYENLIIVSDNDDASSNMDALFLKEFKDKVKFIDKSLYLKNDINDELIFHGGEQVKKIVESGRFRIEGRRDLDLKPYTGIIKRSGNYIATGLPTIDNALNDLAPGLVTLIVGRQNSGKTTLTKQIIANAISTGNKVYVCSGEGDQETFINEIYQCVIGRNERYYNRIKVNKKYHKEPVPEILESLQEWHKKKLTLFNKTDSRIKNTDDLFKMMEIEIKIKRHNLIILDNLMSLLSIRNENKNDSQADFIQRLHELANCYRTHIILIVHPNKQYNPTVELEAEMISGTSDLANKADNVISVTREYDEAKTMQGINGKIKILKNRYYTNLNSITTKFDNETGQLLENDNGIIQGYNFNLGKYIKPDFMSRNRGNK